MASACVFCGIVAGDVSARLIRRDGATTAFLDLRQPRAGHVLVVPDRHVENLYELSFDDGAAVMTAAREVARVLRAVFEPEGLSLWQSNGPAAFQEVPRFHLHLMPRWHEDGLLRVYPAKLQPLTPEELDGQAMAIRDAISE